MELFIPASPKIKYIVPKVIPTIIFLNDEKIEDNSFNDINEDSSNDENDFGNENNKSKLIYNVDNSLDDLGENSIFKTLLSLKKKKESVSYFNTTDSF